MKYILILFLIIFFSSCSNQYEQYYENYSGYDKANVRNKSWFPKQLIFNDTYALRNISCLDSLSAFGQFNYSKSFLYDSVFNNKEIQRLPIEKYLEKIQRNKINKPQWFHTPTSAERANLEIILIDRFYIARDSVNKKISYVLSN